MKKNIIWVTGTSIEMYPGLFQISMMELFMLKWLNL